MTSQVAAHYWMRPLGCDDIAVLTRWFENIGDIALFDRRMPVPLNSDAVAAAWREALAETEPRSGYWFAIDDSESQVVGIAGLQEINYAHGDGVFPVYLAEPSRWRGIGVRAGAMVLDLAFSHLRLRRVTSFYRADNQASRRLTDALGFREEGRLRESWYADGAFFDISVIGILANEWQAQRQQLIEQLGQDTVVFLGRTPWGKRSWPPLEADGQSSAGIS